MVFQPPRQQLHSPVDVHQQNLHQDQQLTLPTNFILLSTLILCWKDPLITNHKAGTE